MEWMEWNGMANNHCGGSDEKKSVKWPLDPEEKQALEDLTVLSQGMGRAKAITELNPYLRHMAARLERKHCVWLTAKNVRVRIPE
jgi:hypothetical protein